MSEVPSRQARLAHAAMHAHLWNGSRKDEWSLRCGTVYAICVPPSIART